jgi:hypothetical protein
MILNTKYTKHTIAIFLVALVMSITAVSTALAATDIQVDQNGIQISADPVTTSNGAVFTNPDIVKGTAKPSGQTCTFKWTAYSASIHVYPTAMQYFTNSGDYGWLAIIISSVLGYLTRYVPYLEEAVSTNAICDAVAVAIAYSGIYIYITKKRMQTDRLT